MAKCWKAQAAVQVVSVSITKRNNNNNKKKRERDPKAQQKREGEEQIRKLQSLQHLAAIFEYFVGF